MAQHGLHHDILQISGANKWVDVNLGAGDQTFDPPLKGLYIGTAGNVRAVSVGGDDKTFVAMANGIWHPMPIRMIKQSGTTASNMIGGYETP